MCDSPELLDWLEKMLKDLPEDMQYTREKVMSRLEADREWLVGYGPAGQTARLAIMFGKYIRFGDTLPVRAVVMIGKLHPKTCYEFMRSYLPDESLHLDIRQACESFDNDVAATCDVLNMKIIATLLHVDNQRYTFETGEILN